MAPKKKGAAAGLGDDIIKEIAAELNIGDYKGLHASAQNLNKTEENQAKTKKTEVYDKAIADGADEDDAQAEADAAFKREVYKLKMSKAYNTRLKKAGNIGGGPPARDPAVAGGPPDAVAPLAGALAATSALTDPDLLETNDLVYWESVQNAVTCILGNKHFAGIETTLPNPIQQEDAGDSGVQEPYDEAKCDLALDREKLYRAGANFCWLDFLRTLTPGVPLSLDRITELSNMMYPKPRPFQDKVHVEGKADKSIPRTSKLLMLMPEESAHAYLMAINRDIAKVDTPEETILLWKKYCLSVCFEYHELTGGVDSVYWKSWNLREQVSITNTAVMRTARKRACEMFQFKKRLVRSGVNVTAEFIAASYSANIVTKEVIDVSFVHMCLSVHDKICKYVDLTAVIEKLENVWNQELFELIEQVGKNHRENRISVGTPPCFLCHRGRHRPQDLR